MKKTMNKVVLTALFVGVPSLALAGMGGVCSSCHTMHNSEQGAPVAYAWDGSGATLTSTPNPVLLKGDCYGCHARGQDEMVITEANGAAKLPQVYHTDPAGDLAGGNFAYIDGLKDVPAGVSAANSRKGHNVVKLLFQDDVLTVPPGYTRGPQLATAPMGNIHTFGMATAFSCAGKAGCHGNRNRLVSSQDFWPNGDAIDGQFSNQYMQDLPAMKGAHHANVDGSLDDADTIANSFRFLYGTKGYENDTWVNEVGDHNEYYGLNNPNFETQGTGCERCHEGGHGAATSGNIHNPTYTMSGLCETCHSNFHSSTKTDPTGGFEGENLAGAEPSFLRHPVDYVMGAATAGTEYSNYSTYNVTAPVARTTVATTSSSSANLTNDAVMCLSCHMSHASAYDGMLRFDYKDMVVNGGESNVGCFACHATKDSM